MTDSLNELRETWMVYQFCIHLAFVTVWIWFGRSPGNYDWCALNEMRHKISRSARHRPDKLHHTSRCVRTVYVFVSDLHYISGQSSTKTAAVCCPVGCPIDGPTQPVIIIFIIIIVIRSLFSVEDCWSSRTRFACILRACLVGRQISAGTLGIGHWFPIKVQTLIAIRTTFDK